MQFVVDGQNVYDWDVLIEIPMYKLLIDFMSLDLRIWVDSNARKNTRMDMTDKEYAEYQLNALISEYLKTKSYSELEWFQKRLIGAATEIFQGQEQKTDLSSQNKISYEVVYHRGRLSEYYTIEAIDAYCIFALARLSGSNTVIRKCENCGGFFIPSSRSDEIYCDRIIKGVRRCKAVGYEQKILNNPYTKVYRSAYKTKNAYKLRNIKNMPGIEDRFIKWNEAAKQKLEEAQAGEITLDQFTIWLKGDL